MGSNMKLADVGCVWVRVCWLCWTSVSIARFEARKNTPQGYQLSGQDENSFR